MERIAAGLAELLRPGDCVLLAGPLGAGKTTLARALIRARAAAPVEVPSPTFTLVQDYPTPGLAIRHVDLYRLGAPEELLELGLGETDPETALLVEWPERGGDLLPRDALHVRIEPVAGDDDRRRLTFVAGPGWADRLARLLDG